ncbi:hypothetical protein ACNF40_01760 [Cuniculiplasma sp. SKW4]|uniref:hypothetical protein n=1 Tax=Cuniculiplasma sp. SKW4 TaxID=3400171 RepID=UPI003FCFC098
MAAVRIEGDYSNITTYFGQMLSIKKLREFDLHTFHLYFEGYQRIIDADRGLTGFSKDFPDSKNVDRIVYIEFTASTGSKCFSFKIGWDYAEFEGIDEKSSQSFMDLLDQSTFRFF